MGEVRQLHVAHRAVHQAPTFAHAAETFLVAHTAGGAWSSGTATKYRQTLTALGTRLAGSPVGHDLAALDTPAGAARLHEAFTAAFGTTAAATRVRHLSTLRSAIAWWREPAGWALWERPAARPVRRGAQERPAPRDGRLSPLTDRDRPRSSRRLRLQIRSRPLIRQPGRVAPPRHPTGRGKGTGPGRAREAGSGHRPSSTARGTSSPVTRHRVSPSKAGSRLASPRGRPRAGRRRSYRSPRTTPSDERPRPTPLHVIRRADGARRRGAPSRAPGDP